MVLRHLKQGARRWSSMCCYGHCLLIKGPS